MQGETARRGAAVSWVAVLCIAGAAKVALVPAAAAPGYRTNPQDEVVLFSP